MQGHDVVTPFFVLMVIVAALVPLYPASALEQINIADDGNAALGADLDLLRPKRSSKDQNSAYIRFGKRESV